MSNCMMEYYSALKRVDIDSGYGVDEPGGHDAQWMKPDTEGRILPEATYIVRVQLNP